MSKASKECDWSLLSWFPLGQRLTVVVCAQLGWPATAAVCNLCTAIQECLVCPTWGEVVTCSCGLKGYCCVRAFVGLLGLQDYRRAWKCWGLLTLFHCELIASSTIIENSDEKSILFWRVLHLCAFRDRPVTWKIWILLKKGAAKPRQNNYAHRCRPALTCRWWRPNVLFNRNKFWTLAQPN
jgi:hypothetical protein